MFRCWEGRKRAGEGGVCEYIGRDWLGEGVRAGDVARYVVERGWGKM